MMEKSCRILNKPALHTWLHFTNTKKFHYSISISIHKSKNENNNKTLNKLKKYTKNKRKEEL